jgi:hypothetical protein
MSGIGKHDVQDRCLHFEGARSLRWPERS